MGRRPMPMRGIHEAEVDYYVRISAIREKQLQFHSAFYGLAIGIAIAGVILLLFYCKGI